MGGHGFSPRFCSEIPSGGQLLGLEGDVVPERFELSDEASCDPVGVLAGEVVAAGFVVELAVGEHVPGGGEDRVADGGHGLGVAATPAEPLVLGGEVGVFGLGGGERGL